MLAINEDRIEACFRTNRHDLRIRPVFHWKDRRIRGHIALCYMAFCCARHLRYRLAACGTPQPGPHPGGAQRLADQSALRNQRPPQVCPAQPSHPGCAHHLPYARSDLEHRTLPLHTTPETTPHPTTPHHTHVTEKDTDHSLTSRSSSRAHNTVIVTGENVVPFQNDKVNRISLLREKMSELKTALKHRLSESSGSAPWASGAFGISANGALYGCLKSGRVGRGGLMTERARPEHYPVIR